MHTACGPYPLQQINPNTKELSCPRLEGLVPNAYQEHFVSAVEVSEH